MGTVLYFDRRTSNREMPTIIEEVLSDKIVNGNREVKLKKKDVAALLDFTKELLTNEDKLEWYIKDYPDYHWNKDLDEIKESIADSCNCFIDTLIEMIVCKKKYILVKWV